MSWKVEVAMDDSGEWVGDPQRFATKQGALIYARDLELRCSAVRATRVVGSEESSRAAPHGRTAREARRL